MSIYQPPLLLNLKRTSHGISVNENLKVYKHTTIIVVKANHILAC